MATKNTEEITARKPKIDKKRQAVSKESLPGISMVWIVLGYKVKSGIVKKANTTYEVRNWLLHNNLPFKAVKSLSDTIKIDLRKDGKAVFGLGEKTIQRRESKRYMQDDESTMVFRIAEVVVKAIDAFDDKEKAVRWLHKPCIALNNEIPLYMLRDDLGRKLVEDVLAQIKYGIFS
jgi:putative toxin-antitoxin system antitoxin component (TIGR02293 family)